MKSKLNLHLFVFTWVFLSIAASGLLGPVVSRASGIVLPKDADGWTLLMPTTDTVFVYVSATGDDAMCKGYRAEDLAGNDPFEPGGAMTACATFSQAYKYTRENLPDWILFERGGSFNIPEGIVSKSGRNSQEPYTVGAYGAERKKPVIKTGMNPAVRLSSGQKWVSIYGLDFYAHVRDPDNESFNHS